MQHVLRLVLSCLCLGTLFGNAAHAETYVYVTNTTAAPVTVQVSQSGDAQLALGSSWGREANVIPAYATRRVMWMNRNVGITNGKTFYFDTTVSSGDSSMVLRQKLTGTLVSSNLWHSARGAGFNDPWYGDRNVHQRDTMFAQKASVASYRAKFTGGYDDVHYVVHNKNTVEPASGADELKVLSYNVWALPVVANNICARLDEIANNLDGYDVVALQEIFDNDCRARFLAKVGAAFPYQSRLVDIPSNILLNGGSMVLSRWPIMADDTIVFDRCVGSDCLANKGANYVQILKNGKAYHLSNTHAPSTDSDEARQARFDALGKIRTMLDSKKIPASDALLIAGDMNINKYKFPDDYARMQSILRASAPASTGYAYTYDAAVNVNATSVVSGGSTEYLDYILVANENRQPVRKENNVRVLRSLRDEVWYAHDLSDHFPVAGLFAF
ncbi:sphingomyelin phosphodiesterase [Massilia sp. CCM 9210]|uniref:sphingomyelin phosphodiesterase n=1 Tax=Massilia scottii TaxID=3057166 RepID=UPI0027967311|nr:sphingomyelin phosphodiesterase [Massilia sp. CCM 9210]MDQ1814545.1 sphingomyelin phosphodiesterase [Massilia sp. CCM 9210]